MSVYTPGLLSDKYKVLTKEGLESFIEVGMSEQQIMIAFRKSRTDLDLFCQENYNGLNFTTVFATVRVNAQSSFLQCLAELGIRGNNSAIAILKETVLNMKEKENDVVNVRFVNNIANDNENEENENGEKRTEPSRTGDEGGSN